MAYCPHQCRRGPTRFGVLDSLRFGGISKIENALSYDSTLGWTVAAGRCVSSGPQGKPLVIDTGAAQW
jgi:hypothetical protein